MERLLNMIARRLMNKGLRAASRRAQTPKEGAPEARRTGQAGQQNTGNLRQATRMLKRLIRF